MTWKGGGRIGRSLTFPSDNEYNVSSLSRGLFYYRMAQPRCEFCAHCKMTTYARLLVVGTMLATSCASAAEPAPVAFAKSLVSERGSQTFRV